MTIYQVDSFTSERFKGNPAGVCVLREDRPDAWKQAVAREMNVAETAFVLPRRDGYELRWFTPAMEVRLCGHATLASAHILWERGFLSPETPARFDTRYSGLLTVERQDPWLAMDFPALTAQESETPPALREILGVEPVRCSTGEEEQTLYLVELQTEAAVRGLDFDSGRLMGPGLGLLIVTARAEGSEYDFVSRFFAPGVGIPEDPVTGMAHCYLAPYWARALGKERLTGYQASARGGTVRCRWRGERVTLLGQAVTVLEATLLGDG